MSKRNVSLTEFPKKEQLPSLTKMTSSRKVVSPTFFPNFPTNSIQFIRMLEDHGIIPILTPPKQMVTKPAEKSKRVAINITNSTPLGPRATIRGNRTYSIPQSPLLPLVKIRK